jgi:serine/threonine-protein kinase
MGVIAAARHLELDEPVALKFLKPEVLQADAAVAERFVREARATIKIRSEHVPRIFDVTTLDTGVPYIVMELLVGVDLDRKLVLEGRLPVAFTIDVILQALEALAAAHALGMVHRDFKPANLFLSTRLDGSTCAKVLDFGIAKLVNPPGAAADHGLTSTNAVMGSPRYMSPEQMRASRHVDARADIWAVGTTLYEVLTGAPPFDGQTLTEVCAAILQDEPEAMARRSPGVPAGLEAVVRRCMAKRPDDRFRDVAELAAALAPFGTQPAAGERASTVMRVLGASRPSAPSHTGPSLPDARATPSPTAATVGATSTAWQGLDPAASRPRRRRRGLLAVFAVLFATGCTLGAMTLLRARRSDAQGAATANADRGRSSAAPRTEEPPVATSPVAATASAASGTLQPTAAVASARPRPPATSEARATAAAPRPSTTSSTKPASPPTTGALWDERK